MSINMEFRSVVFNAARDGKLRRLKVGSTFGLFYYLPVILTKVQKREH